jgi:hypothetical protein
VASKAWLAGHARYMVTVSTESFYVKSSMVTRLQSQHSTGIGPILSLKTVTFYVFCWVISQEAVSSSHDLSAFSNDLTTFISAVLIYFQLSPQ